MDFFCSKDCPDLCGMEISATAPPWTITGKAQNWCSPGFVCAKFNDFATREINNGLLSWQKQAGELTEYRDPATALDALAGWLDGFRDKNILLLRGSGSLGYNMGYWDQLFSMFRQCHQVVGDPCNATGETAHQEDFGSVNNPCPSNLETAETIILYGKNAAVTSPHFYVYLKKLKAAGAEIILLDPVRTATAALADHYMMIHPACDGLLACALLTELGYEQNYPVAELLATAGISDSDFQLLLDRIRHRQVAHVQGLGLQRQENGMNAVRWINRLAQRTGATDRLYYGHGSKRLWRKHPAHFSRQVDIVELPARLAAGEFDLLVNIAANPAVTYPDSQLWATGLQRTPTLVVDTNRSATAAYADFFLKVGGMFAQEDFQASYFFPHQYTRAALTDELSDLQAVQGLASRLNIPLTLRTAAELALPALPPRVYQTADLDLHWPQQMRDYRLLTASHPAYLNSQIVAGQEQGLQVVHINPGMPPGSISHPVTGSASKGIAGPLRPLPRSPKMFLK
jgi:hypothetical protein